MNPTSSMPREFTLDRIGAMLHQEQVGYRYDLYLPSQWRLTGQQVDMSWREKICQWSYNVVDHFDLPRELVAISLDLFDRYMATRGNDCNGNIALLASLTTLHISIKIHAEKKIKICTLASLSRGQFDVHHIEEMEMHVLSALGWKLHPPTLFAFISHFLMILPGEVMHSVRKEIFELSIYMSELSVCDSFFVQVEASTIAFASIVNVLEDMPYARVPAGTRETFLRDLADHFHLSCRSQIIMVVRQRLRAMFSPPAEECLENSMMVSPIDEVVSLTSANSTAGRFSYTGNRSRSSSIDSKGSCRYSPASNNNRRRCVVPSSPMTSSRGRMASSPVTAMIQ